MTRHNQWLLLAGSALAAVISAPAFAQTTSRSDPAANQPSAATTLDEIVVTAQRRSQNLQEVPLAITAATAETLERAGIQSTMELPAIAPGLVITQTRAAATPYLRGVGTQNDVAGSESGVAVYVDGVYIPSTSGIIFSFNNIERIEVLKGPQGTLFGRNATGGLLQVVTKDPSAIPTFAADVSVASYSDVTANAYVSGPIVADRVKADFAVHYRDQADGFGRYTVLGGDAGTRNDYGFRSKVAITATPDTDITLAADYYRLKTDIGIGRVVLPGTIAFGGATFQGKYNPQTNFLPYNDSESYGVSARIVHDFDFGTLTSTTAYREVNTESRLDQDGTPLNVVDGLILESFDTFQQELLLQGARGNLNWTTGLFYYDASAGTKPLSITSSFIAPLNIDRFADLGTKSYSAFGQGTYAVTDTTNVTFGLRYTVDDRTVFGTDTARAGNPRPVGTIVASTASDAIPDEQTDKKVTWRIALDHQLTDRAMVYAAWNRGFKSGAFNAGNPYQGSIDPETLDAYSVGFKSEAWDRQIRFNVEGYYYDYTGIQLQTTSAGITTILNAASGRVYGADAELMIAPRVSVGDLNLTFGLSVLNAKYEDFPNAPFARQNTAPPFGNITFAGDASGNDMIKAPKWTLSSQFSYSRPIGSAVAAVNASWYHNDGFFFDVQNASSQDAYDLVNAEVSLAFRDETIRLRVFAKNLFDEDYLTQADTTNALGSLGYYGDPRTYGVGLSYAF